MMVTLSAKFAGKAGRTGRLLMNHLPNPRFGHDVFLFCKHDVAADWVDSSLSLMTQSSELVF